jgi:hypothetical protein
MTVGVVTGTLGIAAASWVVTAQQMRGMHMGAATDLGSPAFFMWRRPDDVNQRRETR